MSRPGAGPPSARGRLRTLAFAVSTVLGWRPHGFFIPYRYAHRIPARRPSYPAFEALFAAHRAGFKAVLGAVDRHGDRLAALGGDPPEPRWQQDWFPRLDGAVAYTLVRERAPRRIVEIGSGHSTRFMARAIRDGGLETRLTAIDPRPRADISRLAIDHVATTAQEAGLAPFAALEAGDMLFVDSSHVMMPGSDVDMFVTRILPILPSGVLVHFHDIMLPDDYPEDWAWRGYNEQQAVASLLVGGGFRPVFASHFAATRMIGDVAASAIGRLPLPAGAHETSLWLEKLAQPLMHGPLMQT